MKLKQRDSETLFDVESEGMMEKMGTWISIDCVVEVKKETAKAYQGNIIVYECDEYGRCDVIYDRESSWIPKSMSDNPWWICTKIFDFTKKVSNRRFDDDY